MADITGGDAKAGFKLASIFGTAVALGAGDGFGLDSYNDNTNPTELSNSPLGRGQAMLSDTKKGALAPTASISGKPSYEDAWAVVTAAFFGLSPAPTILIAGEFEHRQSYLGDPLKFGTTAREDTTLTVKEYPSAYPVSLQMTASEIPNFLQLNAELVAGDRDLASVTNTNATMAGITISDTEEICVDNDSQFLLNLESGGALASPGDILAIQSFDLTLNRNKKFTSEIKGVAGVSAPLTDGLMDGTLVVVQKGIGDHTFYTAQDDSTFFKAQLVVEGTNLGTNNKSFTIFLPRLKVVIDPDNPMADAGINPATLTFKILEADVAPIGMADTKPYLEYVNARSTAYIP